MANLTNTTTGTRVSSSAPARGANKPSANKPDQKPAAEATPTPVADAAGTPKRSAVRLSPIDRVYQQLQEAVIRVQRVARLASANKDRGNDAQKAQVAQIAESATLVVASLGASSKIVVDLKAGGYSMVEPVGAQPRLARVELDVGAKVYIKAKATAKQFDYLTAAQLDDLYVEKLWDKRVLVRFGKEPSNGQVSRMLGYVIKSNLTTSRKLSSLEAPAATEEKKAE